MFNKISIIGLGLIGGSLAKSIKKSFPNILISAYDKPETLERASRERIIDEKLDSPEAALSSEAIFLALPIETSIDFFIKLAPILPERVILSDVGGVKGVFENLWQEIESEGIYVGGHPMTGKEKGGYENSDPLLFENTIYILSNLNQSNPATGKFAELLSGIGARIIFLDPYEHDRVAANVSHLPQLLSVALVNNAAKNANGINNLDFAAGGFRDMTRIASSDYNVWRSVIKNNKQEILEAIIAFKDELSRLENAVKEEFSEQLEDHFKKAQKNRDGIPKNTKGFLHPLYDVFIYVNDVPGIISSFSTALYKRSINIKDIELLKIREGAGGTFRLSFDSEKQAKEAKVILREMGFETD